MRLSLDKINTSAYNKLDGFEKNGGKEKYG